MVLVLHKLKTYHLIHLRTFDLTTHQRIGIYGGIIGGAVFIVMLRATLGFLICLAAARNLHNKMFGSILRTQMLFFTPILLVSM